MRLWRRVVIHSLLIVLLVCLLNGVNCVNGVSGVNGAHAQADLPELDRLYSNPALGYVFAYPDTWTVQQVGGAVIAGAAQDVQAIAADEPPSALTIRIVGGNAANFKLAPGDGLNAVLGTARAESATSVITNVRLAQHDAARADVPSGTAVAVAAAPDRWIVISGMGVPGQWSSSEPLFNAVLATFGFNVAPILFDKPFQGSFDAGTGSFNFTFTAHAGDIVSLTMIASEAGSSLDPALALYGPDGTLAAQNDDSFDVTFGTANARLARFPIPTDGLYTIHATRSTDSGGDFVLALRANRVQAGSAATPAATP